MLRISYHSIQIFEIWVSCDNAIFLRFDVHSKKKGGSFIRYTTWPLAPHRFLNNRDGLKIWLSDDNTKEDRQ